MSKKKTKRHKTADHSHKDPPANHHHHNNANAKAKGPDTTEEKSVKKRKVFFKHVEKKQKEKKPQILPPKDAQAFSANWRNLAGVLNSKQTTGAVKSSQQREEQKPGSAAKHLHREALNPQNSSSQSAEGLKTERSEETGAQQNQDQPSSSKQQRAEKRRATDGEKNRKKKKVEELEEQQTEPDIWFDDVDVDDIEATLGEEAADIVRKRSGLVRSDPKTAERSLIKENAFEGLTRTVAMDCEMVGVGPGGEDSMLARVSIVNLYGKCVYDKYVKPTEKVTDYRTAVSGIRPGDIANGEDVRTVQREVAEILKGRLLVGHAVHNDLKILLLGHPKKMIRDTQKYRLFKNIAKTSHPALRVLCSRVLNVKVQQGEHSSVQDAQATMRLYTLVKKNWEADIKAGMKSQQGPEKAWKKPKPKHRPGAGAKT